MHRSLLIQSPRGMHTFILSLTPGEGMHTSLLILIHETSLNWILGEFFSIWLSKFHGNLYYPEQIFPEVGHAVPQKIQTPTSSPILTL